MAQSRNIVSIVFKATGQKALTMAQKIKNAIFGLKGAIAGVSFALITRQLYKLAIDSQETASKFNTVFGDSAAKLDEVAKNFGRFAGLTITESRKILGTLGGVAQGMGMAQEESAAFSEQIFRLAADLGSFNNLSTEDVSQRLTAALTGERESMKRLGVVITEVEVQKQALLETGKTEISQLTQADKAYATLTLTAQKSGVALGDVERTKDSLANRAKRLRADLMNTAESVAARLIPAFEQMVMLISENRGAFVALADALVWVSKGFFWFVNGFRKLVADFPVWVNDFKWLAAQIKLVFMRIDSVFTFGKAQERLDNEIREIEARIASLDEQRRELARVRDEQIANIEAGTERGGEEDTTGVFSNLFGNGGRSSGNPNAPGRGPNIRFTGNTVSVQDVDEEGRAQGDARVYAPDLILGEEEMAEIRERLYDVFATAMPEVATTLSPVTSVIEGLNAPVEGLASSFLKVASAVRLSTDEMGSLNDLVATSSVDLFMSLGDAMQSAFTAMVTGAQSAGKAFAQAMLAALSNVAKGFGDFFIGKALGAVAEGLLGDPKGFAAAAKYGLAAAAMYAVAGFAGGAAYGGAGGAGGFSARDLETRQIAESRQEAVVVIEGGFLNMNDPRQEEQFVQALESLSGRRVTVRTGG